MLNFEVHDRPVGGRVGRDPRRVEHLEAAHRTQCGSRHGARLGPTTGMASGAERLEGVADLLHRSLEVVDHIVMSVDEQDVALDVEGP